MADAPRELTADEAARLTEVLRQRFRHPFAVSYSYVDDIPRSEGGKFEDYKDEMESA